MPWGEKEIKQKPSGLILTVDTREKARTFQALKRLHIPYVLKALPAGDFESEKCIAERKDLPDLIQSIKPKSRGNIEDSRFSSQMDGLCQYADETNRVPYLFVSGSLDEAEAWFKRRGYNLNRNSIIGALASASVRYGVHVFAWFDGDDELIKLLHSAFTKVEEGKYMLPHRTKLRRDNNRKVALWCTILRTTPSIARGLIDKCDSFQKFLVMLDKKPYELEYIRGVGPGTVEKWKSLLL